jgi:hypothetical protein
MAERSRKRKTAPKESKSSQARSHQEQLLDEALEATFPASDPVAMLEPAPASPRARKDGTRKRPSSRRGAQ